MKKRILSMLISTSLLISAFSFVTNGAPSVTPDIFTTTNSNIYSGALAFEVLKPTKLKGDSSLSYYNSADLGYMSGVKNQLNTDTCWTFTQNEIIEANLRKTGQGSFDLSEQTMKFETSSIYNSESGYERDANEGGNELMSLAYLTRNGTAFEAQEPFSESTQRTVDPLVLDRCGYVKEAPICTSLVYDMYQSNPDYYTNEEKQLMVQSREATITYIKDYIVKYGAVGSSIFFNLNFFNDDFTNYCYTSIMGDPNHAITIVGWDDTYSASNFKNTPTGDGAFIVKNSHGEMHGGTCYFYISYYDKVIGTEFFATEFDITNDLYDNIYQYDKQGFAGSGYFTNDIYECVTVTKFLANNQNEQLTAVSTYTTNFNTTVEVLVNTTGAEISDESSFIPVATKTFKDAGYHLLEFPAVDIDCMQYAVAIRYISQGSAVTFPICMNTEYIANAKQVENTAFVGTDFTTLMPFESIASYKKLSAMPCVKAFTKNTNSQDITNIDSTQKFTDVAKGKWYVEAVDYAVSHGVFNGVTDTTFEPLTPMNRAMFVKVLANMISVDLSRYKNISKFADVPVSSWYAPAVAWANQNGIVLGVSDTAFEPLTFVSRQQMCTMLVRYAGFLAIEFEQTAPKAVFADDNLIQNYAKQAVYACQMAGIVKGVDEQRFSPRASATRAEVAKLLMSFCQNYLY